MVKKTSWLEKNPVDYYNQNHSEEAIEIVLRKNKKLFIKGKDIVIKSDSKEPKIFMKRTGIFFKIVHENNMGLIEDLDYSPFQIFCKFAFNNNFKACFLYVGLTYMDMNFPYVRVGVKYFKLAHKVDRFGVDREELLVWSKDEIKQDYGKEMLARVNTYDDFIIEPNNEKHQKAVRGFYNLYSPFPHEKKSFNIKRDIKNIEWSLNLMKHIFGDQLHLGMRYLKVLYEKPKQALPILVLISEERQTGKSTFVDWLSIIFGGNMVIVNPQDIGSSFNSSYATKNIIAIEESRFDSIQTTEKLKALATQKTLLVNTKFVTPYNTPFYGKLIITSNDEQKFSKVDEAEIRYWVRKIPTLKGKGNHNILSDLTDEIPYFLHYLSEQDDVDYTKSRQVFTTQEIETDALTVVKKESKESLHKDIEIYLDDFCSNNPDIKEVHFIPTDLKNAWFKNNNSISANYVAKIIRDKMKLERMDIRSRYEPTLTDENSKIGMYFIFKNKYFNQNIEDNDEAPF
tara:strand:- start:2338 stop:3873 length:1536 start_codon:yes stop_codon:yes gene_type:complete